MFKRGFITVQRRLEMAALQVPEALAPMRAMLVQLEQLGDLKLYRVPERTTLASRQIKQVRLLDRHNIPVELYYSAELPANTALAPTASQKIVRTRNDAAHELGLPLPSGQVESFISIDGASLLLSEVPLRDIAVDEEVELKMGTSPNVQVESVREKTNVYTRPPFLRGVARFTTAVVDEINRVEIHNGTPYEIKVELRLQMPDGTQLIAVDATVATHNGQLLFKLPVPANRTATVRYQTEHISTRPAVHK
jgi:hypothetical protein